MARRRRRRLFHHRRSRFPRRCFFDGRRRGHGAFLRRGHGLHRTTLIDLDAQGTGAWWSRLRNGAAPRVLHGRPLRVQELIRDAVDGGAEQIVIDTPPRTERGYYRAIEMADAVVIPTEPTGQSLLSISESLRMCEATSRRAVCVVNRAHVHHPTVRGAFDAITRYKASACPVVLHSRIAHQHAFSAGQSATEYAPDSKAAAETAALTEWIGKWTRPHSDT